MRKPYWTGRGRISGTWGIAYKHVKVLEYLAILAVKNSIDADEFFNSIVEAWKKDESQCKQLTVRCRKRTRDSAVFLFIDARNTMAQFPVPTAVLQGDKSQLEPYVKTFASRAPSTKENVKPKVKDLRAGMKKVNLKVKVLEIPEPNVVYTRSRIEAHVANVLVGDETGTIRMCLWNEQINMVSKDDVIEIGNGEVANYRGELQLRIRRNGNPSVIKRT
jgi:replication factor A1